MKPIEKFKKLVEIIQEYSDDNSTFKIFQKIPMNAQHISDYENALNVNFPESYKDFLKSYGGLALGGYEFYGESKNPYVTLINRGSHGFHDALVNICSLGDGSLFCIDTRAGNKIESPIVYWRFSEKLEIVAPSFGDFILETIWNRLIEDNCAMDKVRHLQPDHKGWNYSSPDIMETLCSA